MTARNGTSHPARALSDGTLRFLALAVLELDSQAQGLLCLEEPENGIHPERIPKILKLLQDIATDVDEAIGIDNPLRQVIINTHSPSVVMQVPDDSLLVAELKETVDSGKRFKRVSFGCLPDTWRQKEPEGVNIVPKGKLLAYLNPVVIDKSEPDSNGEVKTSQQSKVTQTKKRRVVDRNDLQPLIPGFPAELV
ncbi:AAA family ATPase [uncultured Nostoc sp.]|uniref:AAA family ATPase n=1 Tax=uncultured Nostoc sp. TaxID=340711 RepID=UPI00262F983B|nr:ATP-binding protein [uncultured Nostoc sp.]